MKKMIPAALPANTLLCLFACLLIASCQKEEDNTTTDQPTPSTLSNGLLLYMPFDNNLVDSSGNGNTATAFGGVAYGANRYFETGKSLTLNGSSRVEVTAPKLDTLSRFTLYLEFRPVATTPMTLLSRTQFAVTPNMKQSFNLMTNFGTDGTRFQMKKAGNCDNTNTATAFGNSIAGNVVPSVNGWNYIAVTYDGATIQTYVNGRLAGSGAELGANLCSGAPFIIGSWWQNDPYYFNGNIDELRIYNRVLSSSEISQLYQLHK